MTPLTFLPLCSGILLYCYGSFLLHDNEVMINLCLQPSTLFIVGSSCKRIKTLYKICKNYFVSFLTKNHYFIS